MRHPRYNLVVIVVFSIFTQGIYAQTDVPYINPPVIYDYSGDSDSSNDATTQFTPDSEALYIKVIGFNPSGTETHRIEVWNPAGELYFSENFGMSRFHHISYFLDEIFDIGSSLKPEIEKKY